MPGYGTFLLQLLVQFETSLIIALVDIKICHFRQFSITITLWETNGHD